MIDAQLIKWPRRTKKTNANAAAVVAADVMPALIANTVRQVRVQFVKTANAVEEINPINDIDLMT